uniref:SFRICE_022461 n=1 Tax=Spodoptera frugiperda TaxID=7108 RepID=A0A2H1VD59_SPOFR
MALNPLNELKRRLDDDKTPLPKRLCLAKNVVQSHHFPTAPKERIVAEWLCALTSRNRLNSEELKSVLDWLSVVDDLTSELKSKLVQIVAEFTQRNPLQVEEIQFISTFLENPKIVPQLSLQTDEYLTISITLLQHLKNDNNTQMSQKILNNFIKYYRESKKKFEFIIKLLNGENLETIFSFLDTDCRKTAIDVCQNILFPINKRTFFISFLQTLIRKDNLEALIAEKGDNIQSVIKIMNTFFQFPNNRSDNDIKFLHNFIDVFVSSFQKENQIIFAFYIMVANVLNMEQSFIVPAMNLPPILEDDAKTKRILFLNMLEVLLRNEIDINVRLTDTFGEKISKVEIKKNFTSFLQAVMMGQLKLEGKLDKTTLQIIKTALKLDPILIEQKINTILPPIMTTKKNSSSLLESYTETINCLLEILFKLSRGTTFLNQILPSVKNILEAGNTEQFELKQKVLEAKQDGVECEKMEGKIITGSDLFPQECVTLYGKLTSELMFRQNKELLELLQKDFEVHCLMMLEEGFVSPSIITLTEVLSAILSSFLQQNKMADHTVPLNIAEGFWTLYSKFETECLAKFGVCVLKLSYNPPLVISFLKLCQSFAQLKLLNIKYSNVKLDISPGSDTSEVFDLSMLLPCLNSQQWTALAEKIQDDEAVTYLDNLLLAKTLALQLLSISNQQEYATITSTKTHLIKQIATNPALLQDTYFCKALFTGLEKSHIKTLAKCLIKLCLDNSELDVLRIDAVVNNRELLNMLVLETAKNIAKTFENGESFSKVLGKADFNIISYAKDTSLVEYFNEITINTESQDILKNSINIYKQLPIYYLEENYQLVAIFVMLAIKKCSTVKKLKRSIDYVLQSIYELSSQRPDLYQLFPADNIFNFKDNSLLDLLTLKIKTPNTLLIIKSLLELAVKKVRIDSDQVKNIVERLLKKNRKSISNIEAFNDPVFQITCLILPSIVKQKKAITASAFRSILAELQEKLHKSLLESFKNINFGNSSFSLNDTGNTEDSVVLSESSVATLNAMVAYSLTLSRYSENPEGEDAKHLDCLLTALEFFVQNAVPFTDWAGGMHGCHHCEDRPEDTVEHTVAVCRAWAENRRVLGDLVDDGDFSRPALVQAMIKTTENPDSKPQHIDSSIQLLNVVLRRMKKLETHSVFQEKDKLFLQIWRSIKTRLMLEQEKKVISGNSYEEIGTTLKLLCELSSVECYVTNFVGDLNNLVVLKKPSQQKYNNAEIKSRKVFKFLWSQCLKANIVGPKCVAMSKLMHRACKNLRNWMRQHYDYEDSVARVNEDISTEDLIVKVIKVDDEICEIVRLDLDALSELLLAAKKISLDYSFVDVTFEVQHLIHYVLSNKYNLKFDISWEAFFMLFEGCVAVLNNMLLAREEVLEDRWPCYMQCYRALITSLCERATSHAQLERKIEEKLAEMAHSIEKYVIIMFKTYYY